MIDLAQFKLLQRLALLWVFLVAYVSVTGAAPVISEFMASNTKLADNDGAFSDWVEIHNPDAAPVDLSGWYLTDTATARTKWKFPAITLPADGYIVVWASNKNRRDPSAPLHTNFALSAGGEYLGLIKPDGETVVSEFAPVFPAQSNDISYGYAASPGGTLDAGFFRTPTPGAANSALMLMETVTFSREAGTFADTFTLSLTGAGAGQHIRYIAAAPSATGAAIPEPDATSTEYTGPITIDSTVIVRAAIFSDDDVARGLPVAAQYLKLDPSVTTFTSQLPIMVLDQHGIGDLMKDGIDHPSWLYTYAARPGASVFTSAPDLVTPLTSTVRGSSSADFPKKGYNFKLNDELGNKRSLALLTWPAAYDKWSLVTTWFYDRSYIHNAFAYALSNRLGRWAPRLQFTELFLNNNSDGLAASDYAGIYALTDRLEVNKGRIDVTSLSATDTSGPALTGGYVFKIDIADPDEFGWITAHGNPANGYSSVILVYPKAEDIVPTQRDYLQNYVQKMEDALYNDQAHGWASRTYLDYIDRSSWVDYHLLTTFSSNLDAFERSTYFSKDRNGKIVAGPVWDFDRAFNSADPRGLDPKVWNLERSTDFWRTGWFGILAQDPEFMQDWVDRWQSLRQGPLSNGSLTALADAQASAVGNDAAARDAARWPDNASRYADGYAGEVSAFKTWLTDRASWIDQQFLAAPVATDSNGSTTFTPPAGAQLAYTLDGSDPRSLGGAVAPNAQLTSAPLTISAGANLHVRSYRAELRNVFPGSPWSSAVALAGSSPLRPAAKLINLSSRALIGSGENALIAGVTVADTDSKSYLARAVGPTLGAFGTPNTLPDPMLGLFRDDGAEIYRNGGWQTGPDAARLPDVSKSVGAFPLADKSHDAAMITPLSSGAFTLHVTSESGQGGVGLAELYTLDNNGRTTNLSTRALVRSGEGALIGGFVVQGPAYKRMLVRAVGPGLTAFGVADALDDPVLTIYSGEKVVATVDDWSTAAAADLTAASSTAVGAFSLAKGSKDAALFVTLPPGAYTVEISGKNGAEGVSLLEIYDVP
jgi:hypothetical protein